eukprot:gi/632982369/ref/XP_007908097.1/ PREDICTED: uncharacterized protein LOC103189487 isoform X2 [Callorhinchus milii]
MLLTAALLLLLAPQGNPMLKNEKYMFAPLHSTISLTIFGTSKLLPRQLVTWNYINPEKELEILKYECPHKYLHVFEYYKHRIKFFHEYGTIQLHNLEMIDHGLYKATTFKWNQRNGNHEIESISYTYLKIEHIGLGYRIFSGLVCGLNLGIMSYAGFLFLRPQIRLTASFLLNQYIGSVFLSNGAFSVIVSCNLIRKAYLIVSNWKVRPQKYKRKH